MLKTKDEVELLFSGHGTKYIMLAYLLLSGLSPLLFICTLVNLIVKHFFVFAFWPDGLIVFICLSYEK